MPKKNKSNKNNGENDQSPPLFDLLGISNISDMPSDNEVLKLRIDPKKLTNSSQNDTEITSELPSLALPTRWEHLQPKIQEKDISLQTVVRPVDKAMRVVRSIVDYLKTTGGCQVLVIRADTGSGKTTFLNTLPYYIQNIEFHTKTIDLQPINNPDDFGSELRKIDTSSSGINLIILEGREKPESINDRYIQITLSDIN